jgi:hypothetical protein
LSLKAISANRSESVAGQEKRDRSVFAKPGSFAVSPDYRKRTCPAFANPWHREREKGGQRHKVPAHHNAGDYVGDFVAMAGIAEQNKTRPFRFIDRHRCVTDRPMLGIGAWRMIKRRASAVGLSEAICDHTFQATGITAYLENGGTIERAQQIANHESPKTSKLYDSTSDQIDLDEIETIRI